MKPPTFAPAYVALFPVLSEIAQKHGYALCAHGSVQTDFDLLAVPWTDAATDAQTLVDAIAKHCRLCFGIFGTGVDETPEQKPHGRRAWNLFIGAGSRLDFGVMPRIAAQPL